VSAVLLFQFDELFGIPTEPAEGLTLKHLFQPFQPFNGFDKLTMSGSDSRSS
jgi:hypothetical protein